jgi:hypothetical protein
MDEKILEKLSELEHEQWCDWASVLSAELSSLVKIIDEHDVDLNDEEQEFVLHVKDRLSRWEKLMIPYSELPDDEKDKDREYAVKIFSLFSD